jgi:hypothetical protein
MPQRAPVNRDAPRAVLPPIPPQDTGTDPVSARATPRIPDDDRRPSARSLRGLDGLNFLMADVRDGLGPYLFGYPVGFLSLAVIAVATLVFFAALMPETRDLRDRPAPEARRDAEAAA